MTDIRVKELSTIEGPFWDWYLRPDKTLDDREELATAVRLALGTDALSSDKEVLPDPDSVDRRGWWGDLDAESIWNGWPIGCKNWLLSRAKITDVPAFEGSTLARAKQYTRDALKPFIDQRICTAVDVEAVRVETQRIEVYVKIYRGDKKEIDLRYQLMWEEAPVTDDIIPTLINTRIRVPFRNLAISSVAPTAVVKYQNIIVPQGNLRLSSAPIDPSLIRMVVAQGNLVMSPTAPFVGSGAARVIQPLQGNLTITSVGRIISPARRDLVISSVAPNAALSSYPAWVFGVFYNVGDRVTYLGSNYQCTRRHYASYSNAPGTFPGLSFWTVI